MPSFCDFYSPTLKSLLLCLSFFLSLFNSQFCLMCEAEDVCVRVCAYLCLFLCLPVFSLLSLCVLKCPLVSANHFWSISEIYGQFFPIIPASFQSLHHPSLYSPSVGSWIVCFSQEDTDEALTLAISMLFFNLVKKSFFTYFKLFFQYFPSLSFSLSFHISFFCLYLLASFSSPYSFFSWQALPTDVAAYVALTGPKQRAACARSAWLQVTSVFINRQIPPSIWEHSADWGGGDQRDADRRRQSFVSFTFVHEAGHAICHVLSVLHH